MKLSLIGMSGSGKSYWSKKLESIGFLRICCDDLIEQKLSKELVKLGYKGTQDVSRWMGQPYDNRYKQTSKKYLMFEKKIMESIIKILESEPKKDIVVDTTGSVIYTGEHILQSLRKLTRVIYLNVPESVKKDMYLLYLRDPKPVLWGRSFKRKKGETDYEALARCYPKFLQYRSIRYQQYAHLSMDYFTLRKPDFETSDFLDTLH